MFVPKFFSKVLSRSFLVGYDSKVFLCVKWWAFWWVKLAQWGALVPASFELCQYGGTVRVSWI
jgi:hypothetical protein